jgi:heptosyltransferase II
MRATSLPASPPAAGKILIVAPAWVGDMVMAHALVQLLLRGNPAAEIHVLAPAATAPLATRMDGVAQSRVLNVGHGQLALAERRALGRQLRAQQYRQAVVLPNTLKSALVPYWARIPLRTGWHGEARWGLLNDRRRLDEAAYPLMIERFMALALAPAAVLPKPYPTPRLRVDNDNRQRLLDTLMLRRDGGVLALCPGAEFGPAKRWPAGHYAAVARHALAQGRQVWLLGSPGDRQACAAIAALAPGAVDLAGKTTLLDAIDLLSAADRVVCNDSGLMHVAGAVGVAVTAVFGSTSTAFTPPLGPDARVVRLGLPCSPCFARQCPLGHLRCLNDLAPDQVIEAL